MKKIIFLLVAVIMMVASNAAAQTAKCLLSHNGNVTLYDASSISSAISAAAVGDTIYLSEGSFPGFTISKNVSFIGAGETSIINGSVTVNISGTTTFTTILLEGAKVTGDFKINSATNNLRIRSCKLGSFAVSGTANNLTVEKCYIPGIFEADPTYVKTCTVLNSRIYALTYSGTYSTTTFVNCNLYGVGKSLSTSLLNCILLKGVNSSNSPGSLVTLNAGCYLTNCLYCIDYITATNCVTKNCYSTGSYTLYDNSYDLAPQISLTSYKGNDGTVVGSGGGANPYTLRPSAPTVTSANVSVNTNTQTLNVNIQVTAQ